MEETHCIDARHCGSQHTEGRDCEDLGLRLAQANTSQDLILTNKKLSMVTLPCHPSYVPTINRRVTVLACPGINISPYSRNI
jgi:hypothetical protein